VVYEVIRKVGKYRYKYEVESRWDPKLKQPRQRVVRFLGRVDEKGRVVVPPEIRIDSVQSSFPIGGLSLFCAVAQKLDIVSRTMDILDVEWDTACQVLCLALNQIGARRPLGEVPGWVKRGPLPRWLGLDADRMDRDSLESALSALCHITPNETKEDRGLALQEEMTRTWRNGSREPAQFYYDVTKQVYHGTNCPYAEPGYFPGGRKKGVLGFGLVTSRFNHHPVLCRTIPGSRNDTVTVQDVVNNLQAWGFRHLTLILDRGCRRAPNSPQ
jgi:hypothetical protein